MIVFDRGRIIFLHPSPSEELLFDRLIADDTLEISLQKNGSDFMSVCYTRGLAGAGNAAEIDTDSTSIAYVSSVVVGRLLNE